VTRLILAGVITVAAFAGWYAATCWLGPVRSCGRCAGTGRVSGFLRGAHPCRRCRGSGHHIRPGRRAWNYARRLHRQATPTEKGT
jgi:hypothetical protein